MGPAEFGKEKKTMKKAMVVLVTLLILAAMLVLAAVSSSGKGTPTGREYAGSIASPDPLYALSAMSQKIFST